jgi:hypothetical protein
VDGRFLIVEDWNVGSWRISLKKPGSRIPFLFTDDAAVRYSRQNTSQARRAAPTGAVPGFGRALGQRILLRLSGEEFLRNWHKRVFFNNIGAKPTLRSRISTV